MPRPPKPEFLVEYETWLSAGPPPCCHTCDHYGGDGRCFIFKMEPPIEFVNSAGNCDQWAQEIPF